MGRRSLGAACVVVALGSVSGCSVEQHPGWQGNAGTGSSSASDTTASASAGSTSSSGGSTGTTPSSTGSTTDPSGSATSASSGGSSAGSSGSTGQSSASGGTAGPDGRTIFATSATYGGDLGGIAGADAICQTTADAASLGGTWKAFLAVTGESAMDHVALDGPLQNMLGQVVGVNRADLLDGSIAAPVSYDENGNPTVDDIWTGTDFAGDPSETCMDWTTLDSNTKGNRGLSDVVNGDWLYNGFRFCNWQLHLYCVSD